jgi:hypothetical protein
MAEKARRHCDTSHAQSTSASMATVFLSWYP